MTEETPRKPPAAVRRQLRQEVGFGCPVEGCGNPYLEYHHFDPPWSIEHHHDPERMIALCATHHAQADAWTVDQVRAMKQSVEARAVAGRFLWMREDVLAVVGGNYFYETPHFIVYRGEPIVWFNRDQDRRLLLNFRMLTQSSEPRTAMVNNDWLIDGSPADVESPPGGSSLRVRYENGDDVAVRFREWMGKEELAVAHPITARITTLRFPLLTVEVAMAVGGTDFKLGPTGSTFGSSSFTGNFVSHSRVGFHFG